ncbi:MAG: type II secretion system F family protein [Nanoarchaeota archaeon]|nr:type II secretion system F family protein [Nanoarchaeota archaeon]
MRIKFKNKYFIGIGVAALMLLMDFVYFFGENSIGGGRWFLSGIIVALTVGWSQFWMDFFAEQARQKEIEAKFLEFVRALVGTVRSGISIPQALKQTADKDYGALTKYTKKLAYQLEWGIPLHDSLLTFSKDTGNSVIKRSISIVLEAEKSGGDMEEVLESVTESVVQVKKMKAERKAGTYSQTVQGYIVYFIFIGIMLLLQIKLFPTLEGMSSGMQGLQGMGMLGGGVFGEGEGADLDSVFFALLMIQGLFAGIMIGKFSEGTIKQGLIHSLALVTIAAILVTTVKGGI